MTDDDSKDRDGVPREPAPRRTNAAVPGSTLAGMIPHPSVTGFITDDLKRSLNRLMISDNVAAGLRTSVMSAIGPGIGDVTAGIRASISPAMRTMATDLLGDAPVANFVLSDPTRGWFSSPVGESVFRGLNANLGFDTLSWTKRLTSPISAFVPKATFHLKFEVDFPALRRAAKLRKVPPNWLAVGVDADGIEPAIHAVLDDGIPLGWVPRAQVVELLLQASDSPARRRVISNNWRGILNDCEAVAGALPAKNALFFADMIRTAIRTLRDGYVEPAQALATNVLDTVVSQFSVPARQIDKGSLLNRQRVSDISRHGWRFALSLRPVNSAMTGRFGLDHRGTAFKRNATSHAITRRQYNRINAVIAIMLATSVLACYVRDTSAFDE